MQDVARLVVQVVVVEAEQVEKVVQNRAEQVEGGGGRPVNQYPCSADRVCGRRGLPDRLKDPAGSTGGPRIARSTNK